MTFNEPFQFTFLQNYPNPFNPSTLIKYNIGKDSHVNLTIYNALGQKVETLVNEFKPAGQYEIKFNASGYSSGIYIARIESGGLSKMIKMSLLK